MHTEKHFRTLGLKSTFKQSNCNEYGWPEKNTEEVEMKGIKETQVKIRNKEIVVSKTDKSGRFCIDSVQNYEGCEGTYKQ